MRAQSTDSRLAFSAPEIRHQADAPPFARIVAETAGYVFGLLHRLGVAACDTEDVAQEVFLAVHEQRAAFEGRSSLKTWICGISVRKAADYRRSHARQRRRLQAFESEARVSAEEPEAQLQLEAAQRAQALQRVLDQLSDKERSVFVLYELEELSMAEVAAALGCPLFTAYTRLRAARKRLRTLIRSETALGGEP